MMKRNKMMKVSILFLFAILLFSTFASADVENLTSSHGVSISGTGALSEKRGLAWTSNGNYTSLYFNKTNNANPTTFYLRLASAPTVDLLTGSFSGNKATINYNLTQGTKYLLLADSGGSSYTASNEGGSSINNQVSNGGTWSGCYYSSTVQAVPCVAVNIESITFQNGTASSSPPSIAFSGSTPTNASNLYELTNQAYNLTASNAGVGAWVLSFYNSSGSLINSYCTGNSTLGCSSALPPSTRLGNSSSILGVSFNFNNVSYSTEERSHPAGIYYYNATFTNATGWTNTTETRQINVTDWNAILNITAINAITSASITGFDGWAYNAEYLENTSYSTSTTEALVQIRTGNITAYIDATGFSLLSNTTLKGFNVSVADFATYNYQFSLYETNTLNITFYDQATPTTLLSGININLDLISSLYANNYSTNNGTMYLSLLTPESYTLRYYATGYNERFYYVEVENRSFQNIRLYLINSSVGSNVTINIINEVLNPVEGAIVKALKYDLPTNTYILQEIATTNVDGKVIMSLTLNDEYYKFIVEYPSGTIKTTTSPAYLTSNTLTIPILFSEDAIQEFYEYQGISYTLSFTESTNNFNFFFSDSSNTASEFCLYVYEYTNLSQTLYDSTCTTGASGTILINVANNTGTTYFAKATYIQNSIEKFLANLYKSFSENSTIPVQFALFLQFLITLAFASLFVVNVTIAIIGVGVSLILGHAIGFNIFSIPALITLQVVCVIMAILFSVKRS